MEEAAAEELESMQVPATEAPAPAEAPDVSVDGKEAEAEMSADDLDASGAAGARRAMEAARQTINAPLVELPKAFTLTMGHGSVSPIEHHDSESTARGQMQSSRKRQCIPIEAKEHEARLEVATQELDYELFSDACDVVVVLGLIPGQAVVNILRSESTREDDCIKRTPLDNFGLSQSAFAVGEADQTRQHLAAAVSALRQNGGEVACASPLIVKLSKAEFLDPLQLVRAVDKASEMVRLRPPSFGLFRDLDGREGAEAAWDNLNLVEVNAEYSMLRSVCTSACALLSDATMMEVFARSEVRSRQETRRQLRKTGVELYAALLPGARLPSLADGSISVGTFVADVMNFYLPTAFLHRPSALSNAEAAVRQVIDKFKQACQSAAGSSHR